MGQNLHNTHSHLDLCVGGSAVAAAVVLLLILRRQSAETSGAEEKKESSLRVDKKPIWKLFPASEFWALSECIKSDQKVFRVFGRVESWHLIKNRQFSCVFLTTLLWLHFLMSHLAREHGKFCENIKTEMFFNHYIIILFFVNNFITENKWNIFFCLQFHYQRYNISCQHWMCLILAHRVRFFLVSA